MSLYLDVPVPPPFAVGEKVVYVGTMTGSRSVGAGSAQEIRPGMRGVITDVHEGWQGSGRYVDVDSEGEPYYDETSDGWSVATLESGFEIVARREDFEVV